MLIGPYTVYSAQKSKQEEFDYYDPKIITDTIVTGTFVESNSEVYKYTGKLVLSNLNLINDLENINSFIYHR